MNSRAVRTVTPSVRSFPWPFFFCARMLPDMIEVELRSFLTEQQYTVLLERFRSDAESLGVDEQETYYMVPAAESGALPVDLRIQQNTKGAKIWMKLGKMHDTAREEIEIPCARDDFAKLRQLFTTLGYRVGVPFYRTRHHFRWEGIDVMVDFTKGYGYVLELERQTDAAGADAALSQLEQRMRALGFSPVTKDEFDARLAEYLAHWKGRVGELE